MTDMGALEHFLKMRVTSTRRFIQLGQSLYTQKVLDKFADFLGPPQKTRKSPLPSDASERIARVEGENVRGRQGVLRLYTRHDIAYADGLLSCFGAKPTTHTCHLIVYLTQYIRGIVSCGISFSGSMFDMHAFTHADWAGDVLTRRSTTGYAVIAAGGPLAWQKKL